jgi:hypothetical protein
MDTIPREKLKDILDACVRAMRDGKLTWKEESVIRQMAADYDTGWRTFSDSRMEMLESIYWERAA